MSTIDVRVGNYDPSRAFVWDPTSYSTNGPGVVEGTVDSHRLDGSPGHMESTAWASSSLGVNKARLAVESEPDGRATARASARFTDRVQIDHQGGVLQGLAQFGFCTQWSITGWAPNSRSGQLSARSEARFYSQVDGSPNPNFVAYLSESVDFNHNGTGSKSGTAFWHQSGATDFSVASEDVESMFCRYFWVPVTFGREFEVGLELSLFMNAGSGDWSGAIGGDRSSYWGGVSKVLVNGIESTDFSMSSLSGTDWTRSFLPQTDGQIPTPGTGLLALAALGILSRFRRNGAKPWFVNR